MPCEKMLESLYLVFFYNFFDFLDFILYNYFYFLFRSSEPQDVSGFDHPQDHKKFYIYNFNFNLVFRACRCSSRRT